MSAGTVLSRLTGVLRLAAIASALGTFESKGLADAYNAGNTAPNIIYELLLGGILTSIFVPVFVELLEKEGRERAWAVASAIINLSVVSLAAVSVLGVIAAPLIARAFATTSARQQEVLTFLLRLFIPQIIFYALAAITTGLLNAHKRFGAPMFTPILNNLAVIAVFVSFRYAYGAVVLQEVGTGALLLLGLGTTAGVALMALAQLPFLRGLGRYRWTLSIRHPAVGKLVRLSVFVIGYVVVNQIGYLVVLRLALQQPGGYTAYIAAFTFFMLPHGLFAVSVITALLPGMSRLALEARWNDFRQRLSLGARATIMLVLPAAVGLFVLAEAIVRALLQYGLFSNRSIDLVAGILRVFVIGLVPFSVFQLLNRAYYALQDSKTPFLINSGAVALNMTVNLALFGPLGVRGLAAGHAASYFFGVTLQWMLLARRIGGLDTARIAGSAVRMAAAAGGMGLIVFAISQGLQATVDPSTVSGRALGAVVPIGAGLVAYPALAALFGVSELRLVTDLFKRSVPTAQTEAPGSR